MFVWTDRSIWYENTTTQDFIHERGGVGNVFHSRQTRCSPNQVPPSRHLWPSFQEWEQEQQWRWWLWKAAPGTPGCQQYGSPWPKNPWIFHPASEASWDERCPDQTCLSLFCHQGWPWRCRRLELSKSSVMLFVWESKMQKDILVSPTSWPLLLSAG